MADEQEIEQDDVIDKAADIGKQIGVDDAGLKKFLGADGKEQFPNYEVVEGDEEDERLAKDRNTAPAGGKSEYKKLSAKEKRDLRKKRNNERFQAKDNIIQQQQEQIQALINRQNEIDNRLSGVDRAELEKTLANTIAIFNQAEQDHAAAFTEGDGTKLTKAMRLMYDAQKRIDQLQGIKQQYDKQPAQPRNNAVSDPQVTNKAQAWAAKNTWYRPETGDEDSAIAFSISGVLVKEGFDPKSEDFWDELDDRLANRGVGDYEDEPEEKPVKATARKRAAPPVGGGSNRGDSGGTVRITLPTAYIEYCKQIGKWDSPKDKHRMIERYKESQRNNQAQ